MEQPVLLSIVKTDANYRFRLDLPEGPSAAGQEYSVDLTFESRERLRRSLQSASQSMQSLASAAHSIPGLPDAKHQTTKLGVGGLVHDDHHVQTEVALLEQHFDGHAEGT